MAHSIISKSIVVVTNRRLNNFYTALATGETSVSVLPLSGSLDGIQKTETDIVLIDCDHDGQIGLQWLTEFKKVKKDVPVIFITNVKSHDIVMNAYKLGVRDYFTKPVSTSEIHRVIINLLSLKKTSTERRMSLHCVPAGVDCKMTNFMISEIPSNITCAVHYIEDNLSTSLSLDDIARKANLSKYHFIRIFKGLTGFSPLEYAIVLRMHRAKKLLTEKDLPISIVAEEVGYVDLRNFDRRFKKHTGLTPSSYRKTYATF